MSASVSPSLQQRKSYGLHVNHGTIPEFTTTFDGSYEPVQDINDALDALQQKEGWDIPIHVDAASGGFVAPFLQPDLAWDFRVPRVKSINTSGHKYGLVYPGVGWIVWREKGDLPEDLIFSVNYTTVALISSTIKIPAKDVKD